MQRITYLDNNATTRVAPEVLEEMLPYLGELYGNSSSMHEFGGRMAHTLEEARARVATLLQADAAEIVFTGCGSESNNMAVFGVTEALGSDTVIITSRVEHPAIMEPCRILQERGHKVIFIGVDSVGQPDLQELAAALMEPGPKLVSMMWANNETGVIFPMAEIARRVHAAGGILHTDAVQAVGKLPEVNMSQIPVDLLSLSGHKLHAPKGVGALFIRRGTPIKPFLRGGHQERGLRAGTENIPGIAGLGRAAQLAEKHLTDGIGRISALRDRLQTGLLAGCPDASVNGDQKNRLPNTLNISFEFVEGEAILYHLSDAGICASSGSACASDSLDPSHVIRAMGIPFTRVHGSVRFSLSRYNTDDDVDHVLAVMPGIISKLRALSPFGH